MFRIVFDARKDQCPCLVRPFLGNMDDYSRTSHGEVILSAMPKRIELLHTEVSHVLAKRKLASGFVVSFRGKLLHIAATLSALSDAANSPDEASWSIELEWGLHFALQMLDANSTALPCGIHTIVRKFALGLTQFPSQEALTLALCGRIYFQIMLNFNIKHTFMYKKLRCRVVCLIRVPPPCPSAAHASL